MTVPIILISSPHAVSNEHDKVKALFEAGLQQFHLRKPWFSEAEMLDYLMQIPQQFHKYVVLHSHYHLALSLRLKGIQVGEKRIAEGLKYRHRFVYYGYSAHSFEDIRQHKDTFTHFFISPVFNSISKRQYKSHFSLTDLATFVTAHPQLQIIALGGINALSIKRIKAIGFWAFAVLGAVWQVDDVLQPFRRLCKLFMYRPYVLSIAGFDPCAGAGVLADIKTFEQHKVQGLAVCSALTYQHESHFKGWDAMTKSQIKCQIDILFAKYAISAVKIGMLPHFEDLYKLLLHLRALSPDIKIVWDPILKVSTGYSLHHPLSLSKMELLMQQLDLLTPNLPEAEALLGSDETASIQRMLSSSSGAVLLKGGHANALQSVDKLISSASISVFGTAMRPYPKHGTGCVLSAAIVANLALGLDLASAIVCAKAYINQFIDSNDGVLGFHKN